MVADEPNDVRVERVGRRQWAVLVAENGTVTQRLFEAQKAAEDFADGERAEYEGLEDCVAKVRHYLANFGEARAIAERAQARAAREDGYRNRAARLLDCARHAG